MENTLKRYWGYDRFRPLQREIIDSVISGHDTLGILPTGGGKSLTFQVPGLMSEGMVLVITPLISLMKDQVDALRQKKIRAAYLHSGMTFREKFKVMERILNDKLTFLYISPERLKSEIFINEIRNKNISFIVVDEAHCISQWGHDFRPSYLEIKKLRKIFADAPMLALTASATNDVANDIIEQLELKKGFNIYKGRIKKKNLNYIVRHTDSKLNEVVHILTNTSGTSIIFVRSRKKTKEIAEYLNNLNISATFYNAGLTPEEKEQRQNAWIDNQIRVMVATNAFGMGIDKPDVRVVIHFEMPNSLEEYYQEAGRAGRDGLNAFAVLLVSKRDKQVLRRRITMQFPDKDVIRRIYTRICVFAHLSIGEGYEKTVEFDLAKFCRTYNEEESVVRPALTILGQAGYVEFIEELENSSRLIVTVDREELYRVKLSSSTHEKILTAILRIYLGLFSDYVFVNEKKIAYNAGVNSDIIYSVLLDLKKQKVIDYVPRRKTPVLYFPTSMEEEKYIVIGRNVYEERKEILTNRVEAMMSYGYKDHDCRVGMLKEYFGEEKDGNCGKCDVCRSNKKRTEHVSVPQIIENLFLNCPEGFNDKQIRNLVGTKWYKAVIEKLRELCLDGVLAYDGINWIRK